MLAIGILSLTLQPNFIKSVCMSSVKPTSYMNALMLYSKIKSNHKKAKERKRNHTRMILAIIATSFAIIYLASCANGKSDFRFKNNEDALAKYHAFLSDLQEKKSLTADELCATMGSWTELRDTVYNFISRDSSFNAHSYLPSTFYGIQDSIKTEMFRLAVGQDRTLKDVLRIKKSTSIYNNEEDLKATYTQAQAFYNTLDSIDAFKADKKRTLGIYLQFLTDAKGVELNNLTDLKDVIRTEDKLFRTFLSHINEYADVSLSDITKGTEQLCKAVYENATDGKLDAKEVMVYMSMRTNRRLVLNSKACIESIKRRDRLTDNQQEAYYWMLIQPFIAIDTFGMAVLTPEQEKLLLSYSDEIQRMEQTHKLGKNHRKLSEMSNLILKLYISGL